MRASKSYSLFRIEQAVCKVETSLSQNVWYKTFKSEADVSCYSKFGAPNGPR